MAQQTESAKFLIMLTVYPCGGFRTLFSRTRNFRTETTPYNFSPEKAVPQGHSARVAQPHSAQDGKLDAALRLTLAFLTSGRALLISSALSQ